MRRGRPIGTKYNTPQFWSHLVCDQFRPNWRPRSRDFAQLPMFAKKRELCAHCAHGQGSALGVCKKQGVFYPSGFLLVNYLAINFRVIYLVT